MAQLQMLFDHTGKSFTSCWAEDCHPEAPGSIPASAKSKLRSWNKISVKSEISYDDSSYVPYLELQVSNILSEVH